MLYAGPLCCDGVVPIALIFSFLVYLNFLTQKIIREEAFMGHVYYSNIFKGLKANIFIFFSSLLTTIWAIGTSVAAAGVHGWPINEGLVNLIQGYKLELEKKEWNKKVTR